MSGLSKSPTQLNAERLLREAAELLKRAAGFASAYPSIGGHKLNDEIAEFRSRAHEVLGADPDTALAMEEETHG